MILSLVEVYQPGILFILLVGLTANATKIKKWVETTKQLSTENIIFALPITRLTSIKSLCQDEIAAEQFALYLAQRVQQQANGVSCPSNLTPEEGRLYILSN